MDGLHVSVEIGLGLVDSVAFVAAEGGSLLDVVVEVEFEHFCGPDKLSARAFDSWKAVVQGAAVSRQEVHLWELFFADVAFESEETNVEACLG